MQTTTPPAPVDQVDGPPIPGTQAPAPPVESIANAPLSQRVIAGIIVLVIMVVFCAYVLGVQFPALYGRGREEGSKENKDKNSTPALGVSLVKGKPHTLEVADDVRKALGIRKGDAELLVAAGAGHDAAALNDWVHGPGPPAFGSHPGPVRAARVVQLAQVHDFSPKTGKTVFRELDMGDHVQKGDVLGVFHSVDVGSKKNDLLDALVQLELDQKILDEAEKAGRQFRKSSCSTRSGSCRETATRSTEP